MTAAQFARLLETSYSDLKSVAFLYEGTHQYLGDRADTRAVATVELKFQGTFVFQRNSDFYLDMYVHPLDSARSMVHTTKALRDSEYEEIRAFPDWKGSKDIVVRKKGIPLQFSGPTGPGRVFFVGDLLEVLEGPEAYGYRFEGWEEVEGHRCLRARLDLNRGSRNSGVSTRTFWFDLERGGHPLRVEYHDKSRLHYRIDHVRLDRFPTESGDAVWLPVSSQCDSFIGKGATVQDDPVIRETQQLIVGTVFINKEFPQGFFQAQRRSGLPRSAEWERLKKAADLHPIVASYRRTADSVPVSRRDPLSVERRLDQLVEKADRETRGIVATPPSQDVWTTSVILQVVLIAMGTLAIAGVMAFRWMNR